MAKPMPHRATSDWQSQGPNRPQLHWRVMKRSVLGAALFAGLHGLAFSQGLPPLKHVAPPPEQPIPFSHRKHVSQGLKCLECHAVPAPGDFAEIASTEKCMACHATIKTDSPAIQKLAAFHKRGEQPPWEPVYLIPDYVFFSHKEHLSRAAAECADCHGPVGERDVLAKERDISMAACMDCHRAKTASLACNYCHEPR